MKSHCIKVISRSLLYKLLLVLAISIVSTSASKCTTAEWKPKTLRRPASIIIFLFFILVKQMLRFKICFHTCWMFRLSCLLIAACYMQQACHSVMFTSIIINAPALMHFRQLKTMSRSGWGLIRQISIFSGFFSHIFFSKFAACSLILVSSLQN